ncbi:hypothetical protein [Bacillus sp. Hm123]|uniref:hypothetical protein n=1 Tax=Bacillus sp. Hm123 TaxID=3450745 RepID=UPI003F440CD4
MSIKPNNVNLSFESIAKTDKGRLIGIKPLVDFNTKVQKGYTYEVLLEDNGFEKIQIKVENHPPLLTDEELSALKEPIYMTFENFVGKFYFSDRSKSFELTCKASKALIIRQVAKA